VQFAARRLKRYEFHVIALDGEVVRPFASVNACCAGEIAESHATYCSGLRQIIISVVKLSLRRRVAQISTGNSTAP
jgi:hypothetical protein